MSDRLIALVREQKLGELVYDAKRDLISLDYDENWVNSADAFPMSLSMPILKPQHGDEVVRSFISGLLPDNDQVLESWSRRFQVSARNPFRLLYHVGEECAGAVQFIQPDRAARWSDGSAPGRVNWIARKELEERVAELVSDHAAVRRDSDRGQFSLAGAQPKLGLYFDEETDRWGIPEGETPTTHILKPSEGHYADHDLNEHFCLLLADHLGMSAASSRIDIIGGIPTIIVTRFDRIFQGKTVRRIHQEDACQALAFSPLKKYERDGGPTAADIFSLIRDYSSNPREDELRFLDTLIYNWLIKGTDAHAKNVGFLIAEGGQIRLAPLYDVASFIPYEDPKQDRKVRMAMKIGGEYKWWKIGPQHWARAAKEWKLDCNEIAGRIVSMADRLPDAVSSTLRDFETSGIKLSQVIQRLKAGILENAKATRQLFTQS